MSWGRKVIRGAVYDLSHLDSFLVDVTPSMPGAPTYGMRVTFGCHTFTRDLTAADTPDYRFADGSHVRCFCLDRYGNSLRLPHIIRGAVTGRVYFSDQGNYLLTSGLDGTSDLYAIYFDMFRAKARGQHVVMNVVSAYPKPNPARNFPTITLATLVSNVAQNKPVKRPKK